ncbi:DUF2780 domain-containing protein [Algisphaera agarilytica]|uniref:DUF2780 domain-containing protein n=1 Tax=Algisphaera agarilytica TaxID=1385975 RepID=A0A7X0LJR5_9BACT|nr:DUF2780 domain-containing protein [Algisphaera agarilytica]MBB6428881.1 hypothetical protein [Algisphaera agarilytica]
MQELIAKLTAELGIDEKQAEGGLGLIMKLFKDQLGGEDFEKIKEAVPGAEALADGAAEGGEGSGGGLMSVVGSIAGALGGEKFEGVASLAGGFDKLGLDASMVTQFLPKVMEFLEAKGGGDLATLAEKFLGGSK